MLRCYYEVLGVERDAEVSAMKKAYRTKALKWHPDKNLDNKEEAETKFKEILNAWEVLQDPQEREWYDDHREEILSGESTEQGDEQDEDYLKNKDNAGQDLEKHANNGCFRGFGSDEGGFYSVFGEFFAGVRTVDIDGTPHDAKSSSNSTTAAADDSGNEEENVFVFGDASSSVRHIKTFYSHFCNFVSHRTFSWHDQFKTGDAQNKRVRRVMEKVNKSRRNAARKLYNDKVRRAARFARSVDPRVMAARREEEARKAAQVAKQEAEMARRKEMKRAARVQNAGKEQERLDAQRAEMIRLYGRDYDRGDDNDDDDEKVEEVLQCEACKKNFKSANKAAEHMSSKAHKKKYKAWERKHPELAAKIKSEREEAERKRREFQAAADAAAALEAAEGDSESESDEEGEEKGSEEEVDVVPEEEQEEVDVVDNVHKAVDVTVSRVGMEAHSANEVHPALAGTIDSDNDAGEGKQLDGREDDEEDYVDGYYILSHFFSRKKKRGKKKNKKGKQANFGYQAVTETDEEEKQELGDPPSDVVDDEKKSTSASTKEKPAANADGSDTSTNDSSEEELDEEEAKARAQADAEYAKAEAKRLEIAQARRKHRKDQRKEKANDKKRIKCGVCGAKFSTAHHYKKHREKTGHGM
jgi:DnaJ family protein A protein 5